MPTTRILGPNGKPFAMTRAHAPMVRRSIKSRYDAAESNAENTKLWLPADGLSARSANSPEVRAKLRNRARYEASANNSYAWGMVQTLANDVIGTGPRLQLMTDDLEVNKRISGAFEDWSAAIGLAEKLRTMRQARAVDGEAFGLLTTNPGLRTPVQLDIRLVEADQVATPFMEFGDAGGVDGIRFDRWGNPVEYHVLREHPGDDFAFSYFGDYDRVPARLVLHWFRVIRPGQVRGIPDITPALPLYGLLRRFTLAVLAAAETAADFAAVLESSLPPDVAAELPEQEFLALEIERRMMTTLPSGWKMSQFDAKQPATTYAEFKHEILKEIARCLSMPFNVAAGSSAGYNYASGRLDHQVYYKSIGVDQYHLETAILDRIFRAWLEEAYLATNLIPEPPDRLAGWPHQWFWDGNEHVDPAKEATAQETRLRNNTTTLADEWARRGHDWREKLRQRAEELRFMAELGIPTDATPAAEPAFPRGGGDDDEDDKD